MKNDVANFYNDAFSNLIDMNCCYFTVLITLTVTLIGFAVVKYFIDWDRVDKKINKKIKKVKHETEAIFSNIMNKWIRSFVLRGNPKYENNIILRLTHNAFAIETMNEVYPNISDEDFLFYTKVLCKHIISDLDSIQYSNFPFDKNESNIQLIQNIENDLCILFRKDNCTDIKELLNRVSSFNLWFKGVK